MTFFFFYSKAVHQASLEHCNCRAVGVLERDFTQYFRILFCQSGQNDDTEGFRRGSCTKAERKGNSVKLERAEDEKDLLDFKRKVKGMVAPDNPPRNLNGKKKGYMQIMREFWDETDHAGLNLTI